MVLRPKSCNMWNQEPRDGLPRLASSHSLSGAPLCSLSFYRLEVMFIKKQQGMLPFGDIVRATPNLKL